jgi:recombinational DNA repair protein RecT
MGNADADKHIKGYLAFFELMNGAYKEEFWYLNEIDSHGKRFSKSFNFSGGPWTTSRAAMREKTVLKSLLSKWGPKSVTMAKSMTLDGASGTDLDMKTVVNDDINFTVDEPQAIEEPASTGPEVEAGAPSAEPVATVSGKAQEKKLEQGEFY